MIRIQNYSPAFDRLVAAVLAGGVMRSLLAFLPVRARYDYKLSHPSSFLLRLKLRRGPAAR